MAETKLAKRRVDAKDAEQRFDMPVTCNECPWRTDVPVGRFSASRYQALESTCRPGGLPAIFACHKSPEGQERACAGFLIVHGWDNNRCRLAALSGAWKPGSNTALAPLYASFDDLARANGYNPEEPTQ